MLEASHQVPVVVDFWAPWCGPCLRLGPVLERLAREAGGAWRLAKVNVDESPRVAREFGVRSIPRVVALRDGRAVSEFVGAQPESEVRRFLAALLPSETDRRVEEALELAASGHSQAALERLRGVLDEEPRHPRARIGLARVLAEQGQSEEALAALEAFSAGTPDEEREAERLAAELRTRMAAQRSATTDLGPLRARVDAAPEDLAARLELGRALAAARRDEEALEELLRVIERNPSFRDEAARRTMVDLFELLGSDHELTQRYRRRLAEVLFR